MIWEFSPHTLLMFLTVVDKLCRSVLVLDADTFGCGLVPRH